MGFLKRFLIKKAIKKATSKSDMEKIADDVLKGAVEELQQTGRTADKILKAKIMRQESRHTLEKIRALDEDFDEEEEEEEAPSISDNIGNALIMKLLGNVGAPTQPKGEPMGYGDDGKPFYAPSVVPPVPANNPSIPDILKKLSPADIEALKKKFIGN